MVERLYLASSCCKSQQISKVCKVGAAVFSETYERSNKRPFYDL